ncbi:hypothetical protein F5Y15DRAFT_422462 [Xylariaceae sp. FL0016]|nr:hypothetical protein F5Y15DRAFT_422462 [Xylariaceae sp. FL0016]
MRRLSPLALMASVTTSGAVFPPSGYSWNVTQYQAGLSHGNPAAPKTSWYSFTIDGPAAGDPQTSPYIPAFGASCTGSGAGQPLSSEYIECALAAVSNGTGDIRSVAARVVPDEDATQAHISIRYLFSVEAGMQFNLTALAVTDWARERPPYNFQLIPDGAQENDSSWFGRIQTSDK